MIFKSASLGDILLLVAFCGLALSQDYDDPFIDPFNIDNSFHMDCGNATDKKMKIMFRGDAYHIFAVRNPYCQGVEKEPGHFVIENAMTIAPCKPEKNADLELYTLEVVVQKGLVRSYNDPTHVVSCNYEMSSMQNTGESRTDHLKVDRVAEFQKGNKAKNSIAALKMIVRNFNNKVVKYAFVGSYIQIQMKMTTVIGKEESLRPWNCKATAVDGTKKRTHFFLLRGCGDGDVIKRNRGFFGEKVTGNSTNVFTATSKSVFFRVFGVHGIPNIQFECTYIVKDDASALGASCFKSTKFQDKKRKRKPAFDDNGLEMETDLPTIRTDFFVIPRPEPPKDKAIKENPVLSSNDVTYQLNRDKSDRIQHKRISKGLPKTGNVRDLMTEPLVVGLFASTCLALGLLMSVSSLSVHLCCRIMDLRREQHDFSAGSYYMTENAPMVRGAPKCKPQA